MLINITKEQLSKLEMLSTLGDYYIDDMESSNPQYEDDKETVTQAQEVIQEINNQFLFMEQMEHQEKMKIDYLKSYYKEINKEA
jgi:Txe/YoeB family toxin of Txe-Axe toxin-antitoxin module